MKNILSITRRELYGYFATPVAYVFLVIFLLLSGLFTFYLGSFYERGQADLSAFFDWHPWLYLFLVPAIAMRLWAEERKKWYYRTSYDFTYYINAGSFRKIPCGLDFYSYSFISNISHMDYG